MTKSEMKAPSGISYVTGDATAPVGEGAKVIVHICNDIGAWGAGFVIALSKRWAEPELSYRRWTRGEEGPPFELGAVQIVRVSEEVEVANLIGQHGVRKSGGLPPVRYSAIGQGLEAVAARCIQYSAAVHMPRIGCGLAGGRWNEVEPLIQSRLVASGIAVTVYDLP